MKIKSICLLLAISFCSCKQDARKEIIKVFQPAYHIKPVTKKVYIDAVYSNFLLGGYSYSRSLLLNSDTTFTYIDDNNTALTGKWRFIRDSVELKPYSLSKHISFHITLSKSTTNPKLTFIIVDKTGMPIQNFIVQPFNDRPRYFYNSSGDLTVDKNVDYKLPRFPDMFSTDSTGTIKVNKNGSDSLEFTKLYPLARKRFRISTYNLPDTIKLVININAISLFPEKLNFINGAMLPPPAKFIIRGNRFVIPFD